MILKNLRFQRAFISTVLASVLLSGAQARTWTSADGTKTFDGELRSYNEATHFVSVVSGGSTLNFKQEVLSADDIAWLKTQGTTLTSASSFSGGSALGNTKLPTILPAPDGKVANMGKPVQVYILMGQSNMVGMGSIASLETAVKTDKKYPYLVDEESKWTVRKDVRNVFMMSFKLVCNDWMGVANRNKVGPEYGIGYYLGYATEAPVMILKSCIGNRSLGWDLLPPGSEPYEYEGKMIPGYRGTPDNPKGNGEKVAGAWYAGKQYDDDVEGAKNVLSSLETYYPGAKKYEIVGFFFWQGDKDRYATANATHYEKNLVQFITQLRKDFDAPKAKFVVATLGQTKKGDGGNDGEILKAQLAVDGNGGKYPAFKGNVASVYTNPFCHGGGSNSHYGGNSETYMDIGEAMGKSMVELMAK